ncbi:glycosyltransferase family 2 protein [Candidatus Williamhamiltonella defendens]|uniref:Glycosyltransferase n=1 Tax=Candidatus Williamhamiltonella defendens TaxID=138072 RepID=A0A2D3TB79_9ENTR|nr:glycosyltransferase family 2 protein [Candidatus Hamiltonella defensa]ATW33062.1 glycosyltransferase [Candidatus Hamiltonella defensa]
MKLSLIVPVFNEEDALPIFYHTVRDFQPLSQYEIEIIFINDGSQDKTSDIAGTLALADPLVTLINFSRNFGKEAALFAGLVHATGEIVIPIDVDLQDPIDVIPLMIEKWQKGADVVLAKRSKRPADSYLKRMSASMFYKVHNKISSQKIEENVGDFRLLSRQVVDEIKALPERNLFMKGILSWVGFRTDIVEYTRAERIAGVSQFNGWKLWNLALEGITSFSTVPLRIWSYLGLVVSGVAFIYAAWMIFNKLIWGNPVPGYPSLMTAILFLGGVQLIGIGVLGEYIGRIYMESKKRPRYIIESITRSK